MDKSENPEDSDDFTLVMPFVCVKSEGGALDDHSFVAGAQFGRHDAELKASQGTYIWSATIIPEMEQQYDLLAMHHGFTMECKPWPLAPTEWLFVRFTRMTETVEEE